MTLISDQISRLKKFLGFLLILFASYPAYGQRLISRWSDFVSPYQLIASEPSKEVHYSKTGQSKRVPANYTKALIIVTMRPGCPVGKRLIPRLNHLQRTYESKGIHFVVLYPNASDRMDDINTHAVRENIVPPIYLDDQTKIDLTAEIQRLQSASDEEYVNLWEGFKKRLRVELGNSAIVESTAEYFFRQGIELLASGKPALVSLSLSRGLGLTRTPEVAMIDTRDLVGLPKSEVIKRFDPFDSSRLVYKGVLDSWANPSIGHASNPVIEEYLGNKIEELLVAEDSKTKLVVSSTQPEGCYISDQPRPFKHGIEGDVTFYDHILPIVEQKCQVCHRPGELGGDYFDFTDHDQLISVAETALEHIEAGNMPPWNANLTKVGKDLVGGFVGDVRLTRSEIDLWRAWVAQQSPGSGVAIGESPNDAEDREWPDESEWQICHKDPEREICEEGVPEFVRSMPETYVVEPLPSDPSSNNIGFDGYRYYYFPFDFSEDRYISAIEIKPGNKSVVHHIAALMAECPKKNLQGTEALAYFYGLNGGGLSGVVSEKDKALFKLADWIPGDNFNSRVYPKDQGILVRKGMCIIFEIHYTPSTTPQEDRSSIGMSFHKTEVNGVTTYTKPPKVVDSQIEFLRNIQIGPYQMHKRVERLIRIPYTADIIALAPHMHYRGKDVKLYMLNEKDCRDFSKRANQHGILPDYRNKPYLNEKNLILEVPNYDFDWQRTYEFEKPLRIRPDQCLVAIGHFENSHFNHRNPDPAKTIRFGVKSTDEMFNFRIKYIRVETGEN